VTLHPSHFAPGVCAAVERTKRDYAGLTNLSSNEFVYAELSDFVEGWKKAIDPVAVARYPYYPRTELAVASFFGIAGDNVVLCPGADEAIRMLMNAMGANQRVILSWPNYESYEAYAQMAGLHIVRVPLQKGESLASHRLEMGRTLSETEPSLVVLTSPHAVTGEAFAAADYEALVRGCADAGHALIVDECYGGFEPGNRRPPLEVHPNVLVLRSFSKRFGMAGMRVAALIGSAEAMRLLRPWRSANPISALSLSFVEHVLENSGVLDKAVEQLAATRDWFCDCLRDANLTCWNSAANFVLVDFGSVERARRAVDALARQKIVVRSFSTEHPFESCIRVTLADQQTMKRVVDEFIAT